MRSSRNLAIAGGAALGLVAAAILIAERQRRLRTPTQPVAARWRVNGALGALSIAVIQAVEVPLTRRIAQRCERDGFGLVQQLPLSPGGRDLLALILSDYAMYLWHVATHRVPLLWRFHLVHHVDLDLDASTALRFHAIDMLISVPVRAAQVALIGVSPRALALWQNWFFASVLFHHSNTRLPLGLETMLSRIVTTPRMHGIHHTAIQSRTDSNWSSGLSVWDHLHGTYRLDAPQAGEAIGVASYRDPAELGVRDMLGLPFGSPRDAWLAPPADALPV